MNISKSYLKHKGWPGGDAQDESILAPFILADSAYLVYEEHIKPLGLKHQFKLHQNNFMRCYTAMNKDFFSAFNPEETEYIIDKMDALHDGICNDIEILRISVINNLTQFPLEVRKNIASFAALVHLSQCARILFGELFKVKSYEGVEPMKNKHLDGMVSYSANLFKAYTLQYAHNTEIIDLNEIKGITAASTVLCNKILKTLNLYHEGHNETKAQSTPTDVEQQ